MPDVVGPEIPVRPQPSPGTTLQYEEPSEQQTVLRDDTEGYMVWRCTKRVRYRSGWAQMAVAGDDSQGPVPSRMVKLHAAASKIVVRYLAIRKGEAPRLPDPRPSNPNLQLIACDDVSLVVPAPDALGWIYKITGRRVYACLVPVFGPVDGLPTALPPYANAGPGTLNISPQAFILDVG